MEQDWSDLEPIYQKDMGENVIVIHCTDEYREAMARFRAVIKAEEKSKRALSLTCQLLELNPSHYSIWIYRRGILDALSQKEGPALWRRELGWTHELNLDNLKTQHRQIVIIKLQEAGLVVDTEKELSDIESLLEQDNKNYHAWSYRTWLVQTLSLYQGELERIHGWIQSDPLNNSAWHYRYYLVKNQSTDLNSSAMAEINYAFKWIEDYMDNECPWVYMDGWLPYLEAHERESLMQRLLDLEQEKKVKDSSRFMLRFRLAYLEETKEASSLVTEEKRKIIKALSERVDPIRSYYWQSRVV